MLVYYWQSYCFLGKKMPCLKKAGHKRSLNLFSDLCEVLDGANHLAGVGVLIVVPGNDLNLEGVIVDLGDHGLGGVKQGAVTDADDVRGDDGIGVVAE